jgi:hypothetical protein
MGPSVPTVKAKSSRDDNFTWGHNVPMRQDLTDDEWDDAFRTRLKQIRGERKQEDIAYLLRITRDQWNKYENRRGAAIPLRLLIPLAKLAGKSVEWVLEGQEKEPIKATITKPKRRRA